MRAYDIATASDRVVAVAFGAEDYTDELGVRRTNSGEEVYFPMAMVAMAARAAEVVAVDSPYVKYRDEDGLRRDIEAGLRLGFKGKFLIHPAQLEIANSMFSPQPD